MSRYGLARAKILLATPVGDEPDDDEVDGHPREQQRRATDRAHDERLQEAALGVAAHGIERHEDGDHRAEKSVTNIARYPDAVPEDAE